MTEGKKHHKAALRLCKLLTAKGFVVEFDKQWQVQDNDRISAYYPDITATRTIVIEVNGSVGHSSKRSFENEKNQIRWFENQGINFFAYSPDELVGRGWMDYSMRIHKPHKDSLLYEEWKL